MVTRGRSWRCGGSKPEHLQRRIGLRRCRYEYDQHKKWASRSHACGIDCNTMISMEHTQSCSPGWRKSQPSVHPFARHWANWGLPLYTPQKRKNSNLLTVFIRIGRSGRMDQAAFIWNSRSRRTTVARGPSSIFGIATIICVGLQLTTVIDSSTSTWSSAAGRDPERIDMSVVTRHSGNGKIQGLRRIGLVLSTRG